MNTELDFMIRRVGATHLVVCGTQYPYCIRTTIFDALSYGYPVINITDATSAKTLHKSPKPTSPICKVSALIASHWLPF